MGVCLITANVGSIFELPHLMDTWVEKTAGMISDQNARFAAIHMQEVGGKAATTSKPAVKKLVRMLEKHRLMKGFNRSFGYFDTNVAADDEYTALGSIYFVHSSVTAVERYNHDSDEFTDAGPAVPSEVEYEGSSPYHSKTKFYTGQFGRKRASRKGYLHTRWRVSGCEFQLVNIHLFADDSNLDAAKRTPSRFALWRHAALRFTLDRTGSRSATRCDVPPPMKRSRSVTSSDGTNSKRNDNSSTTSNTFFFGDFNFRLSLSDMLLHICNGARARFERKAPDTPPIRSTFYRHGTRDVMLLMEKKKFVLSDPDLCRTEAESIKRFDFELAQFAELHELPIEFLPSYPFCEDVDRPHAYNSMRAPAWCDRVVMSEAAMDLARVGNPTYSVIGEDVCMGDHKPVCLSFTM